MAMNRAVQLGLACLMAAAAPAAAMAAGWSAAKQSEAGAAIARFLRPGVGQFTSTVPALSVAIGIDDRLVMAEGFGDAAPGEPASVDTIYRIGSLTKQFTAAAVLKLIEEGARAPATGAPLGLDMQITEVLGDAARWTQPNQAPITVRSLLTMTSNLPNFTRRPPSHLDPWGAIPAQKLLDEVRQFAPSGWPSSFEYSNTNYFLLSAIIDAVEPREPGAERGYQSTLRRQVFSPAGMTSTGFVGDAPADGGRRARALHRRRPAFDAPDWLRGSGDVTSTARDIYSWNSSLMSNRALSSSSRATMFAESARVTPNDYYGMGWFIGVAGGWTVYSHTGSVPGFTAYNAIARDPERGTWASVTLLTNMDGVRDLDVLADELFTLARRDQ